jgi:LuxR family maltose regulon positive regulatory protein
MAPPATGGTLVGEFERWRKMSADFRSRRHRAVPAAADTTPRQAGTIASARSDSSRLAPPRTGAGHLARDALVARLLDARRKRCQVVRGPAGFGKTLLLAEAMQALLPLGFDVAWLSLAPEDDQLGRFVEGLLAAIAEVDPALVREAADLVDATLEGDGAERLVIALVRRIAEHGREFVLVLDDLQHLHAAAPLQALQWLVDYAPPNLRLMIGTRAAVRLALDDLRTQGQMLEIELRDLRLAPAETERFLTLQLGTVDAHTAKLLHELSDGWVAGLQLFCADWKNRQRSAGSGGFSRVPMRDAAAFAGYFERELLGRLPEADLDLLVRIAACERICAPLCAAMLGRPEAAPALAARLARAQADNLFIVEIEGSGPLRWYRLHPLLRETLLERLAQRSPDERRQIHGRACAWLQANGRIDEAIAQALRGGDAATAAQLVEQHAQALFTRGNRRKLLELVKQLPPAEVLPRTALRFWMARAQLYARELHACAATLAQLQADLPGDDQEGRFLLAGLLTALAVQRDDTDSVQAALPQLLQTPPQADALAVGGRNNLLSWLYMHRGEFEHARRIQFDAPKLALDGVPLLGTPAGSLQGRCLVGLSYAMQGEMTKAERVYRAVLSDAEAGGRACVDPALLATALLGDVLYERNQILEARRLLEGRLEVLERVSIPDSVLRVLRVLSAAHWLGGHPQEALAYLDRLEDYARTWGLDRLLAYSLADRCSRRLLQGDLLAAEAELQRLDEIGARQRHTPADALDEIDELVQRTHVRWLIAARDYDSAAKRLEPLIAACVARGRERSVAQLLLQSARVDLQRGRAAAADAKVLDALRRGHRLGLLRTLLDADAKARELIGDSARRLTLDPVLAFYAERLQASRPTRDATTPARTDARVNAAEAPSFNERELSVLRLLAQAMPNKKIARALSLSPETVKWYLSRIYGKLQVSGRDEAVARVRDLGPGGGDAGP